MSLSVKNTLEKFGKTKTSSYRLFHLLLCQPARIVGVNIRRVARLDSEVTGFIVRVLDNRDDAGTLVDIKDMVHLRSHVPHVLFDIAEIFLLRTFGF